MSLNIGHRDTLDVLYVLDRTEALFELCSDIFVGIIYEESYTCLHQSESDGLYGRLGYGNTFGKYSGNRLYDSVHVDFGPGGKYVISCYDLHHIYPSWSGESAFAALVFYTLIAALSAPADLLVPALGALKECITLAGKPYTA